MSHYYQPPTSYSSPILYPQQQQAQNEYYQHGYYAQHNAFDVSYQAPVQHCQQGRTMNNMFMNEGLRGLLMGKNKVLMMTLTGLQQQQMKRTIPKTVQEYHTLYPLDSNLTKVGPSRGLGIVSECYKAVDSNGEGVVLRRIVGWTGGVPDFDKMRKIEFWKSLRHPNVISLRSLFLTNEFYTTANAPDDLIFVYEYFYGSETLETHFTRQKPPAEELLWSYIIQMVSALCAIHTIGPWRLNFDPSKILIAPIKRRLKLNCIGIMDIISPSDKSDDKLQKNDIKAMGELLLNLANKNPMAHNNATKSLQDIRATYSAELCDFIQFLLQDEDKNLDIIVGKLSIRMMNEMTSLHEHNDYLESELTKELDNGRLFRLLCKIDFVTQHADELAMPIPNTNTSTITRTDATLLNLFRDYLFHQNTAPDYGHIVDTLNKLEAGSNEKILLMSRDEQTLLVVGFKDLKRIIKTGFDTLTQ